MPTPGPPTTWGAGSDSTSKNKPDYSLGNIFSNAATGLGSFADIFSNPSPGKLDFSQMTQQDMEQFIQNLVNTNQLINSNQLTNTSQETGSTITPNLDPATQQFMAKLMAQYSSGLKPIDLRGYQAGVIQDINRSSDINQQSLNQVMASRGLARSPVAASSQAGVERDRFGQINRFNATLPLLQQDINMENLGAAANFFQAIPKGQTTTGYGTGQQSQVGQQSTAGQTSSVGQQTGSTNTNITGNQTMTAPKESTLSKILRGAGTVAGIGASIFSDAELKENVNIIESATEKIMKLKPVTWDWRPSSARIDKNLSGKSSGFLAQDLEKILPSVVHKDPNGSGFKKVNYHEILPYLVGAVQELAVSKGK